MFLDLYLFSWAWQYICIQVCTFDNPVWRAETWGKDGRKHQLICLSFPAIWFTYYILSFPVIFINISLWLYMWGHHKCRLQYFGCNSVYIWNHWMFSSSTYILLLNLQYLYFCNFVLKIKFRFFLLLTLLPEDFGYER